MHFGSKQEVMEMPIWKVAPVELDPQISLVRWQILEIDRGTRHFIGCNARNHTGRVSSAVTVFDRHALLGETRSGRIYELIGKPGVSEDAHYVWAWWCVANSVVSYIDVTAQALERADDDRTNPVTNPAWKR